MNKEWTSANSIVLATIILIYLFPPQRAHAFIFDTKKIKMWETVEWSIENKTYDGNPFDLIAHVEFISVKSEKVILSKMFFAGKDKWKFRFTANHPGRWRFVTHSEDPQLDKHNGFIEVYSNDDPQIKGFLTHKGNQFAIWKGNQPSLEPYQFRVYMNEKKFQNFDNELSGKSHSESPFLKFRNAERIENYLQDARSNGFDIVYIHPGYPHIWCTEDENGFNPRFETFDIIENVLSAAKIKGMRIHIWMWGDDQRKASPKIFGMRSKSQLFNKVERFLPKEFSAMLIKNGINGDADKRLQRYIAARLGPLPGWSMGYGFDLHEWVTKKQLNIWASYMHNEFGWDHLLSARGFKLNGKNNMNSYDGFGRDVDLSTSEYGPKDYYEIRNHIISDKTKPHFYEERHTYKRKNFNLDMDGTRRLLWRMTLAGGMGGWFGFYSWSEYPYLKPEQLNTVKEFWRNRLNFDMISRISETGEMVLSSSRPLKKIFIYKENTKDMHIDFIHTLEKVDLIAVDTKKKYEEIGIEFNKIKEKSVEFPYESDWVLYARVIK